MTFTIMRHYLKIITLTIGAVLLQPDAARLAEQHTIVIDDFESGISVNWQEKTFNGQTQYSLVEKDNQTSIMAESKNSASGLFYKINYAPNDYPLLEWSWQIETTVQSGDARHKKGDDYAARIYVVFPNLFFWRTKALNYIWANKLPVGEFCANAYTSNNVMIAVQSGNQKAGQWLTEQRNIIDDYQQAFGEAPPEVGAIAIMTDTDNTGEEARAWYGAIKIKPLFLTNQ
nr:DUF3047 domain-containing protein [Desulfobulbaceae bacterium]